MNLESLQALVTAAELNSFSLAAEKLHLTQPAVSKRIATLETHLGKRLFDRIGRKIYLTEAGKTLLPHAYRIIGEADNALRTLQNLSGNVAGHLTVATTQHIGLYHLPQILHEFIHSFTDVTLHFDFMSSESAYASVLQGKLDLAIITSPAKLSPQICFTPLWLEALDFATSADHPLAQLANPKMEDLSQYRAVLPGETTFTRKIINKFFEEQNLELKVTGNTDYIEAIKVLVTAGFGWGVLPRRVIDQQLKILEIKDIQFSRQIGCIYQKSRTQSNASQAFLDLLQSFGH
ncbi:MAG: LysR family transcriptional regulator [SAR324 cluster bacterium]|uniref:LysR family transcriptional regulator n=1 Tax=SAR324 cluster bacterium TaxID=2024889 RepID=A0A2A4T7S8_9DELT|nr:MAG: LysR family transcriptional regulator [SAR324 cluster bacterium]